MIITVIEVAACVGYMTLGVLTAAAVGRHYYWHTGTTGEWESYDEHAVVMGAAFVAWPVAAPMAFAYVLTRREPKEIRRAREQQQLREFARREGLEL